MEITEEKLAEFVDKLRQINNISDGMVITLLDTLTALHSQVEKVEVLLGHLTKIAKQGEAGPSSPASTIYEHLH